MDLDALADALGRAESIESIAIETAGERQELQDVLAVAAYGDSPYFSLDHTPFRDVLARTRSSLEGRERKMLDAYTLSSRPGLRDHFYHALGQLHAILNTEMLEKDPSMSPQLIPLTANPSKGVRDELETIRELDIKFPRPFDEVGPRPGWLQRVRRTGAYIEWERSARKATRKEKLRASTLLPHVQYLGYSLRTHYGNV